DEPLDDPHRLYAAVPRSAQDRQADREEQGRQPLELGPVGLHEAHDRPEVTLRTDGRAEENRLELRQVQRFRWRTPEVEQLDRLVADAEYGRDPHGDLSRLSVVGGKGD